MIWSKEHHLEDINVLFSRYMTGFWISELARLHQNHYMQICL